MLNKSCFFGGIVDSDPIDLFPTILTAGIAIYFLFLPVCESVQLVERFADWRRYIFIISIVAQIAAIMSTAGFISFIELGVRSAQPFLVGGSENTWGFGQILAIAVLILPTVERLEYGFSRSKDDESKSKLKYWIDMQSERIQKSNYPGVPYSNDAKCSVNSEKFHVPRSLNCSHWTRQRSGYNVSSRELSNSCSLVSVPSFRYHFPKNVLCICLALHRRLIH